MNATATRETIILWETKFYLKLMAGDDGVELTVLRNALEKIRSDEQQFVHFDRKIAKYHERMATRNGMVSLHGALRVYRAYHGAVGKLTEFNDSVKRLKGLVRKLLHCHKNAAELNSVEILPVQEAKAIAVDSPVAVYCQADSESEQRDWILATVVASRISNGALEYDVHDMESNNGVGISHGKLSVDRTVQAVDVRELPRNEMEAMEQCKSIRVKQNVLALYPGTTCLYPAVVVSVPTQRRRGAAEFSVKFMDDDGDAPKARTVPARFILALQ